MWNAFPYVVNVEGIIRRLDNGAKWHSLRPNLATGTMPTYVSAAGRSAACGDPCQARRALAALLGSRILPKPAALRAGDHGGAQTGSGFFRSRF